MGSKCYRMTAQRRVESGIGIERSGIRTFPGSYLGIVRKVIGNEKATAIPGLATDDISLLSKIAAIRARTDLR